MTTSHTAFDLPGPRLSSHVVNAGDDSPDLHLPESAAASNGAGVVLALLDDGHPPAHEEKHRRQASVAVTRRV
jgi:hypothetical protein